MFLHPLAAFACAASLLGQQSPVIHPRVQEAPLRAHLSFLADDLLEGRGTGQRGGRLAVRYLETQLQALGLRPAFGDSFLQPVKLLGIRTRPAESRLAFVGPMGELGLRWEQDFLLGSGAPVPELNLDAPLLFVGHGITLGDRDDFKGVEVRGKILVALVGDRPGEAQEWGSPSHFAGRWTYKMEEARRRGAAGILLIHMPTLAGYDWKVVRSGWIPERFHPDPAPAGSGLQGWLTEDSARKLFSASGLDFDSLCRTAHGRDFHPVPLAIRLKGNLASTLRRFEDMNVAGLLPGSDPGLQKELVIYSAHWDHLGIEAGSGRIFHGAVDNASGCAGLLAMAQALRLQPSRRSQMFLFTCAEEPGLLGAQAFVDSRVWPLEKILAVLNLESLNFAGPTRDIGLAGSERTSFRDQALRVALEMGLTVAPSGPDPAGLSFRADHFAFVKVGIPAFSPGFSLDGGWDFLESSQANLAKGFVVNHYHQPSDVYLPSWDLRGMLQQVQFILNLGRTLADAPERPAGKGQVSANLPARKNIR